MEAIIGGYWIVLPPGWCRIPAQPDTRATIGEVADRIFNRPPERISPGHAAPDPVEIERHLSELVCRPLVFEFVLLLV
jgi:hypothetical protein